jgi:catechol 2,3-dioxygenase-like lactoylglutathione lyase family enzyme
MPAPLRHVLETSLYAHDLDAARTFYSDVLSLDLVFETEGRHVSYRCGTGILHVFHPETSQASDSMPPHGAEGPGHVAFAVAPEALDDWAEAFAAHDVPIEDRMTWPHGGTSLYVRDPAGNSVELATPDLWTDTPHADRLRTLRPHVPVDTSESAPVETFQHATLRPILKMLNPSILALVASYLTKYGTGFGAMDRADQVRKVRNLVSTDRRLKRTLVGMAMGHFTDAEFAFYLEHRHELRRRLIDLLGTRAADQVDALAERITEA